MTCDAMLTALKSYLRDAGIEHACLVFGVGTPDRTDLDAYRLNAGTLYTAETALRAAFAPAVSVDTDYAVLAAGDVSGLEGEALAGAAVAGAIHALTGNRALTGYVLDNVTIDASLRADDRLVLRDHGILFLGDRDGAVFIDHDATLRTVAGVDPDAEGTVLGVRATQLLYDELVRRLTAYLGQTGLDVRAVERDVTAAIQAVPAIREADYSLSWREVDGVLSVQVAGELYGELRFTVVIRL